jgi:hypothetical protein
MSVWAEFDSLQTNAVSKTTIKPAGTVHGHNSRDHTHLWTARSMERGEQIDHCRHLNPSLSNDTFSEIARFRVLFSRPTRPTASCVRHSRDSLRRLSVQMSSISVTMEVCRSQAVPFLYLPQWSKWHVSNGFSYDCKQLDPNGKHRTHY